MPIDFASFAIAARHNGYGSDDELDLPRRAAQAYRTAMHRFADMSYLDVWYAHLDVEEVFRAFADRLTKKERNRGTKFVTKARSKNSLHAFDKLAEQSDEVQVDHIDVDVEPGLCVLQLNRHDRAPRRVVTRTEKGSTR